MSNLILPMPPDPLAAVNADVIHELTDRQKLVCALLARGGHNKSIATMLDIGLRTAEQLRTQAAKVIGIETDCLVLWAARNIERLPTELPAGLEAKPVVMPLRRKQLVTVTGSPAAKTAVMPRRDPTAPRDADPTPEEIAERTAAIRREWASGYPSTEEDEAAELAAYVLKGGALCSA